MKNDEGLKAGERIELEVSEDDMPDQYLSKIEEVIDDSTFVIGRPVGGEKYTYLSVGQVIRVMYCRKEALFYFDAEVIERIKADENISAKISAISDKYKLQRRNYYRLNIMVPVTITADINWECSIEKFVRDYDTVDISGGGIRIVSDRNLPADTDVKLNIKISGIEFETVNGKVVRSQDSPKDPGLNEIAIEFINVTTAVRQAIIRYVFEKQRELIKKGFK